MPLVRLPGVEHGVRVEAVRIVRPEIHVVRAQPRRVRPGELVEINPVRRRQEINVRRNAGQLNRAARHRETVRVAAVTAGHHERKVLHDVGLIERHRVHVHRVTEDGDGIIRAERRREENVFHVVNIVRHRVRATRRRERRRAVARKLVAVKYLTAFEIGHDEVKIVDELDGGGGVARRIRPRQRHAQRLLPRGD